MKKPRSRFTKPHAPPNSATSPAAPSKPKTPQVPLHRPLPALSVDQDLCFDGLPAWLKDALRGPWKIPACDRTFSITDADDLARLWMDLLSLNPKAGPRLGHALYEAALVANLMIGDPDQSLALPNNERTLGEYARRFLWLPVPLSVVAQAHHACDEPLMRLLALHNQAVLLREPPPEMRALTLKGTLAQMRSAQAVLASQEMIKANPHDPHEDLWYLRLSDDVFSCNSLPPAEPPR